MQKPMKVNQKALEVLKRMRELHAREEHKKAQNPSEIRDTSTKLKFSSGSTFDEETYAKAMPYLKKALEEFIAANISLAEFIKFIVGNFGQGIKPYLMRFHQDVKAAKIKGSESSTS